MHKTSNHSNRIAGRAVTCSVSVIHFRVGTSHSILAMRPDDWYAHISSVKRTDKRRGGGQTDTCGEKLVATKTAILWNTTQRQK